MIKLTIYFDGKFWVGLVERRFERGLFAGRFIFGPEPSDGEVYQFVMCDLDRVIEAQTVPLAADEYPETDRKINPKRLLRMVNKEKEASGPSNASQDALRLQLEANKKESKVVSKQKKLEEEERRRQMARDRAKKKHRGH